MVFELIRKAILPKSHNKDKARQEYILNILLLGLISLSFIAFCIALFAHVLHNAIKDAIAPQIVFGFFIFHSILFYLSKKGRVRLASSFLIFFFFPVSDSRK
jgi:vacuolar-type H+-ATPase subunit I/STV1